MDLSLSANAFKNSLPSGLLFNIMFFYIGFDKFSGLLVFQALGIKVHAFSYHTPRDLR